MAEAVFVHGGTVIDYIPPVDMEAGKVVVFNNIVGVTPRAISAGMAGSLAVEGVFDIKKATGAGEGFPLGVSVYWDSVAKVATKTASSNKYIGICVQAVTDDAPTVRVLLNRQ